MARSPSLLLALVATPLLALPACAQNAGAPAKASGPHAEAVLYDTAGKQAGTVMLMPMNGMLHGEVKVTGGLTAGDHGMHIHTIGKCTLPDFTSAGGHLNPDGKQHGTQNPQGPHQGDLPMITASANGSGSSSFMAHTSMEALFDPDGSAFVIHAGADDMKTDPTGNSGGRMLCGVFARKP
jgi:Cu-Zn family superoxide dismutase